MNNSCTRYKLIYVSGAGASGSTLLTKLLGNHPDVVSTGELYRLERYAFAGMPCSCGTPVKNCQFWSEVLNQLDWPMPNDRDPGQLQRINSRFTEDAMERLGNRILALVFWRTWKRLILPNIVADNLPTSKAIDLFSAINVVTGKNCVVDSSKNVPRWWELERSPNVDGYLIHVIRDGRAYLHSRKRRAKFSRLPSQLRGLAMVLATPWFIKRWIQMNLSVEWAVDHDPRKYLRISYDDLAKDPLDTLAIVLRYTGLKHIKMEQSTCSGSNTHQIAGSDTAFKTMQIKADSHWKQSLSIYDRVVFLVLAGWLNRHYGYPAWRLN